MSNPTTMILMLLLQVIISQSLFVLLFFQFYFLMIVLIHFLGFSSFVFDDRHSGINLFFFFFSQTLDIFCICQLYGVSMLLSDGLKAFFLV